MGAVFFLAAVLVILCVVLFIVFFKEEFRGFLDADDPWDPPQMVESIITPEECKYIIDKAGPIFGPSMVVGDLGRDASRTSETAWIDKSDPVVQKIFKRALQFTDKTIDNCENLQVVRYSPGTFYRAHHDSCCEDSSGCRQFEKDGGQRVATLLVYLNDDFTDGETHFPKLDLKMKAAPGSGILFWPMGRDDCKCHPKALHEGLPPSSGIKYVCNAWIRENNFRV